MEAKLSFKYDRDADILYINKRDPYPAQESEELPGEVVVRLNPESGEIENVEVLFFSTRLLRGDQFELPITADLRLGCVRHREQHHLPEQRRLARGTDPGLRPQFLRQAP